MTDATFAACGHTWDDDGLGYSYEVPRQSTVWAAGKDSAKLPALICTPMPTDPWRTLALDLLHYIEHGTAAYHGDTPKLQSFKQRMAELEQ